MNLRKKVNNKEFAESENIMSALEDCVTMDVDIIKKNI